MTRISTAGGIPRRYLHDEVASRLRQLITDGELEPRARINEAELAERFGISRTPLREAIKILATEGLLELLPNRGARVATISEKELDDVLEVVAVLEALAAEHAARAMTDLQIERLADVHEAMLAAWRAGDDEAYQANNRTIHETLVEASGNPTLAAVYANLSGRIQRARYSAPKTADQWRRAIDEHIELLSLLRRRDAAALAELMRRHIRGKKAVIAAAYS